MDTLKMSLKHGPAECHPRERVTRSRFTAIRNEALDVSGPAIPRIQPHKPKILSLFIP